MQLIIHGKNIKIIDVIHNAVEKSLAHLESKYTKYIKNDMVAKVDIERHSNNTFKISVHIQMLNKNYLQCSVEDYDLYVGIRKILVPLEQQLHRLKTNAKHTGEESVGLIIDKETAVKNTEAIVDISDIPSEDEY